MEQNVNTLIEKFLPFSDKQRIDSFFVRLKEGNLFCGQEMRTIILNSIRKVKLQQYFLQNAQRYNSEYSSSCSEKKTEKNVSYDIRQTKVTSPKKKVSKENEETFKELSSVQAIDSYINKNKQWWKINKLQQFVDRIPKLVRSAELRQYFSLAIGKIRNKLKDEQFKEDVERLSAKRKLDEFKRKEANSIQPGDIYGAPQFFRYGEAGRSKKKHGCRVINKKSYK